MAGALVLPGDRMYAPPASSVKLGPGLCIYPTSSKDNDNAELIATAPGMLGNMASSSKVGKGGAVLPSSSSYGGEARKEQQVAMWVESNAARYVPSLHDQVVCQIVNRGAESYTVSLLNSYTQATLPALAFEGATKRNKPNLRIGTLMYAQVVVAQRQAEVEVTCVDATTGKSNGYGELKSAPDNSDQKSTKAATKSSPASSTNAAAAIAAAASANVWPVSCGLARSLLLPSHPLLSHVASHFPFEVAIGVNGFVWVRAQSVRHVIAMGKVLEAADLLARGPAASTADDDAIRIAKHRGALDAKTVAQIVAPFK